MILLAVSDPWSPAYGDRTRWMTALAGLVNLEFRKAGIDGVELVDVQVDMTAGPGVATIVARPGAEPLTVERLRARFKEGKRA